MSQEKVRYTKSRISNRKAKMPLIELDLARSDPGNQIVSLQPDLYASLLDAIGLSDNPIIREEVSVALLNAYFAYYEVGAWLTGADRKQTFERIANLSGELSDALNDLHLDMETEKRLWSGEMLPKEGESRVPPPGVFKGLGHSKSLDALISSQMATIYRGPIPDHIHWHPSDFYCAPFVLLREFEESFKALASNIPKGRLKNHETYELVWQLIALFERLDLPHMVSNTSGGPLRTAVGIAHEILTGEMDFDPKGVVERCLKKWKQIPPTERQSLSRKKTSIVISNDEIL